MMRRVLPVEVTDRLVMGLVLAIIVAGSIWGFVDTDRGTAHRRGPSETAPSSIGSGTRNLDDDASTVAALKARPLRTPTLAPGQACPSAQFNLRIDGVGPTINTGPVAVATFTESPGLWYRDAGQSLYRVKALWLVQASQPKPVIVRGKRIGGGGPVEFTNGEKDVATYNLSGDAVSTAPPQWRDIPSRVLVRTAGCYAFQIDGPGFESTLVLPAGPRPL